jgi:acetoacetyl-CoA reductase/3-oxoacyl-[acyl-carrier protein] reductase
LRVALVTGGTRGIGAAITQRLVQDGNHVVAVYARDDETAQKLVAGLEGASGSVEAVKVDIGDRSACGGLVEGVVRDHGRIDHLVANAGLLIENSPRKMTGEEWDQVLNINLSASFFLSQAALEPMTGAGFGRIVFVSSVTATMGNASEAGYAAAKSGLFGLTRSLARSVARKGITVNCVIPGIFETDMTNAMSSQAQEAIKALIPMGRRGDPRELAHAVAFLLDDRAGYVTGSIVTVDGGISMGG